jgi:hypothetical protein
LRNVVLSESYCLSINGSKKPQKKAPKITKIRAKKKAKNPILEKTIFCQKNEALF